MHNTSYDIIIVGGGIVGMTLACALAQTTTLSIALLESHSPIVPWSAQAMAVRVSAITLASKNILQNLTIWPAIAAMRVSPFNQMQVWEASGNGRLHFDAQAIASKQLGFIVENAVIQTALFNAIKQLPQIRLYHDITLQQLQTFEKQVTLTTNDAHSFTARLVIGADGANSIIRQQADIKLHKILYDQSAVICTLTTTLPHEQIARQIFLPSGPLAFLPLTETHTSSIVWSKSPAAAQQDIAMDDEVFKRAVAQAFDYRLGDIGAVTKRHAFPLVKQQAANYIANRVALVGDAAHVVHPLAGQGVNMGLLDVASLVEVITTAITKRRDIGSATTLRQYERWRRADNAALMTGIHVLKQLFALEHELITPVRAMAINFFDETRVIKNLFIQHAVGNRALLPMLARI